MNNKFSRKNRYLYKMKYINTKNDEYKKEEKNEYDRIEKYNDNGKK